MCSLAGVLSRFVFALFLFAIAGMNQPASAASARAAKPPESRIPQKTPGDTQIEQAIRLKLAKSKLSSDHFTVSVVKGVATIEGSTNVMQHKGVMTRMAKASGATSVNNNIRISDAARAKAVATLAKHKATTAGPAPQRGSTANSVAAPAAIPRATVLPPTGSH